MIDLLLIHYEKMRQGGLSISPARWCGKYGLYLENVIANSGVPYIFQIRGEPMNKALPRKYYLAHKEKIGEYLACEFAADEYRNYVPVGAEIEEAHKAQYLYKNNDVETEVNTPVGRIDCLSVTEIVEIKSVNKWKSALGQLQAYSFFYPNHKKVLLLYGAIADYKLRVIKDVCEMYDVEVRMC